MRKRLEHQSKPFQTVNKVAKPCRAIKRNSIRGPRQIENLVGKMRKNEVFIMNYKEIHSNTEFLSTYCRARACSCRNKIKNTFIEKWLEHYVQATFGTFRLLLVGSTNVQHPLAKYEIYLTFLKSPSV